MVELREREESEREQFECYNTIHIHHVSSRFGTTDEERERERERERD
jgi:hypothetical protein